MKTPALLLCIVAALLTLVFAVQFISFYISPPDLSVPEGMDNNGQLYWKTHTAGLGSATFLASGLIGIISVIAGLLGGILSFLEKRLPLARGSVIFSAGLSYFIMMGPVSFLYLAALASMLREPEKAAEGLVKTSIVFIMATFVFQWLMRILCNDAFLTLFRFEDALLPITNALSAFAIVAGIVLGAGFSGVAGVIRYKRRETVHAAAFAIIAFGLILILTNAGSTAVFMPFVLLAFSLIALIFKLGKAHKDKQKTL